MRERVELDLKHIKELRKKLYDRTNSKLVRNVCHNSTKCSFRTINNPTSLKVNKAPILGRNFREFLNRFMPVLCGGIRLLIV